MSFVLLTFVLTLTLVLGGYWGLVVCPERQVSRRLRQRLRPHRRAVIAAPRFGCRTSPRHRRPASQGMAGPSGEGRPALVL